MKDGLILYILVVVITSCLISLYKDKWKFWKKALLLLAAFSLPVYVYAMGDGVGIDRKKYEVYFISCRNFDAYMENGFDFLILLVKYLNKDFKFLCAMLSLVSFICIFVAIKNFGVERYIGIAYFVSFFCVYFVSFNLMRQMLAASIFLLGFSFWMVDKKKTAYLIVVIAIFIHYSAIVCIFLLLSARFIDEKFKFYNFLNSNRLGYIGYIFLLSVVSLLLINYVIQIVHSVGLFSSYYIQFDTSEFAFLLYFIPKLLVYTFFAKNNSTRLNKVFSLWVISCPLQVISALVRYADRLALFPNVLEIVLVPYIMDSIRIDSKNRFTFRVFVVLYCCIYFYVMYYMLNANGIFPYKKYKY